MHLRGRTGVLTFVIVLALIVATSEYRKNWYRMAPGTQADACQSSLGAIALGVKHYQDANGGSFPGSLSALVPGHLEKIPTCPSARRDTYSAGYASVAGGYTVLCTGHHHGSAGLPADRPAYDSRTGFLRGP